MDGHPSAGELKAFLHRELKGEQARTVVRHLLGGCTACLVGAPQLAGYAPPDEVREADYGPAFERAMEKAWAAFHGRGEVHSASLAVVRADQLAQPAGGEPALRDARGRAWMALGNAHRLAGHFQEALYCLGHAKEQLLQGTGELAFAVRLLEGQAALAADTGNYPMAQAALTFAYKFHRRQGDNHLAGRALVNRGLYAAAAGELEQAIGLLDAGLALIDQEKEPALATTAVHKLLHLLVEIKGAVGMHRRMEPSAEA